MTITWITKDGRRIPLDSGERGTGNIGNSFQLSQYISLDARCPVCKNRVVYYQNSNGSRVFFNQAGWPWEKHECTNIMPSNTLEVQRISMAGQTIRFSSGKVLEALSNGYLMGHYDDLDASKNFVLLRLKTADRKIVFVECPLEVNKITWDVLHDTPFFLREKTEVRSADFPLWIFSSSVPHESTIRKIDVHRTTIPFDECVEIFRN